MSDSHDKPTDLGLSRTGYALTTLQVRSPMNEDLRASLERRVGHANPIYAHAPIVIDISAVSRQDAVDFPAWARICAEFDLLLVGLSGVTDASVVEQLRRRRVPIVNSSKFARMREELQPPKIVTQTFAVQVPVRIPTPYEVKVPVEIKVNEPPLCVRRNIRSGEQISAPGTTLVIFGSVAVGACVTASHHVLIFGNLHGQACAGAPKDDRDAGFPQAFIFTLGTFNPTLVAVAGCYQTADDMEERPDAGGAGRTGILVTRHGDALSYSDPLAELNHKV